MEIIPDKRKVVGLVEQAHEGKICLPNFQRDFVWTREEVADLVRSIVRGYFIGSLLLLRCDPDNPPFAPMFLRGAEPPYRDARPELLVLDGQQRLSSLIYALTAPDLSLKDSSQRRWFFVDLDVLLSEPDSDEVVFDRAKRELRGLDTVEVQYEQRMLPCTVLLSQKALLSNGATALRTGCASRMRISSTGIAPSGATVGPAPSPHSRHSRSRWSSCLGSMTPIAKSIGRVCAIFEKLNSTGVDLSVYDLLTARLTDRVSVSTTSGRKLARRILACARGQEARPTSTSSVCSFCARSLFCEGLTPSRES